MDPARIKSLHKTPAEELKCGWDWSAWLAPGDAVASATHVGTGVTVSGSAVDGAQTVFLVTAGVAGVHGSVLTTMTTTLGETVQAKILITMGAA